LYLKRLEIQGFKSFADKVELEFNQGITAIVGPNGCGKSNIVDAIRWVLGEQSAKTLRGARMDDVIFAGSNNRRPIGMAQVSLTLDNSTGIFPLDFNEVTVSRRLYRSGESEYLINKVPCRMKDIHELFMDTGIGKDGFSVIGQGRVDEILSLKAEDRRILIEEAAGIVKYRYRKREAEKKLADTEQSLTRINDLLFELQEQIGTLEEQAHKALEYKELKAELDQLEISLIVQAIKDNKIKEQEFLNESQALEDQVTRINTATHQLENNIAKDRFQLQILEQKIFEMQKTYYDTNSELKRQEHEIAMSEEREAGLLAQITRIKSEQTNLVEEKNSLISNITKNKEEQDLLQKKYQKSLAIVEELTDQITKQKANIANNTSLLESFKSQLIDTLQEKAQINNQLSKLSGEIKLQEKQLQQLENKLENLKVALQIKEEEAKNIEKKRYILFEERKNIETELENTKNKFNDHQEIQKQYKKDLEAKQNKYQQLNSKLQVLQEMEETGEGYQQGVKAILEAKRKNQGSFTGIIGTVADVITVPKHLEIAIETALGGSLQYLITEDDLNAQKAIDFLKINKKGRATFLPLNTIKTANNSQEIKDSNILGKAVDLINFEPKYQQIMNYLLGRVWIVKDLSGAVALGKKLNFNVRMVTLEGEVISPGGALTGGNFNRQKTGLLTRKRLINELSKKIEEIKNEINKISATLAKEELEQQKYMEKISKLQELLQSKNLEIVENNNEGQQVIQEIKRIKSEEQLLIFDKNEIEQDIAKLLKQKENNNYELTRITEKHHSLQIQIKEMETALQEMAAGQESLNNNLNEEKINLATLKQAYDLGQINITELQQRLNQIEVEQEKLQREKNILEEKINELQLLRATANDTIKELSKNLIKYEEDITLFKEEKEYLQEKINSLELKVKEKQSLLNKFNNEKFQIDMKLARVQMEINQNEEKLKEQYNYNLEEVNEVVLNITNKRSAQKRINELQNRIQQLGQVNFAAIDEFERVKSRVDFLTKQYSDLEEAKLSLGKVIKEMDQIISKKFKETFALVNEAFNKVFVEMFGGGSAHLDLTDDNNLLDTGIEITAQPPGKKAQPLSLLSGGERSMTAIALLFAILEVKPTPFCILDEIEAALDEANAIKFAQFLKKYARKTQFIVISHRKPTMETADILYGVTMENSGVSKLISVRLSDVEKISKVS